jgi:hypothetical protein
MSNHSLDVEEEQAAYARLNILLSNDALAKLDMLKNQAGLASRGRAIQIIIEAVCDVQPDIKSIIQLANTAGAQANMPPQDVLNLLLRLLVCVNNIVRRLGFIK